MSDVFRLYSEEGPSDYQFIKLQFKCFDVPDLEVKMG